MESYFFYKLPWSWCFFHTSRKVSTSQLALYYVVMIMAPSKALILKEGHYVKGKQAYTGFQQSLVNISELLRLSLQRSPNWGTKLLHVTYSPCPQLLLQYKLKVPWSCILCPTPYLDLWSLCLHLYGMREEKANEGFLELGSESRLEWAESGGEAQTIASLNFWNPWVSVLGGEEYSAK